MAAPSSALAAAAASAWAVMPKFVRSASRAASKGSTTTMRSVDWPWPISPPMMALPCCRHR
jgi:hypothetical protein